MASAAVMMYDCAICGQESLTEDEMKTHMLIAHIENSISCPICDLSGITEEEMTAHVNAVHFSDVYTPKKNVKKQENSPLSKLKSSFTNFIKSPFTNKNAKETEDRKEHETVATETDDDDDVSYVCISVGEEGCIEIESDTDMSEGVVSPGTNKTRKIDSPDHDRNKEEHIEERQDLSLQQEALEGHSSKVIVNNITDDTPESETFTKPGEDDTESTQGATASNVEYVQCPVCGRRNISEHDLSSHVEAHFEGDGDDEMVVARQQEYTKPERNEHDLLVDGDDDAVIARHLQEEERNREQLLKDQFMAHQLQEQERQLQERREQEEFKRLQAMYGMDNQGSYSRQSDRNLERAVWNGEMDIAGYHEHRRQVKVALNQGIEEGQARTKGILPRLVGYYSRGSGPRGVQFAKLCTTTDHYGSTYGDRGWGCGYRNLQMLLSSMLCDDRYKDKVFNGRDIIPSIPKLQQLIESAWEKGFDAMGAHQLGGKVSNTRKWIGATEIVAMLSSLYVRCKLIDFHHPTASDGSHPEMFAWVQRYFDEGSRLGYTQTNKSPLYLQHQGHSRTIIGYEQMKDGSIKLLLFDPGQPVKNMKDFLSGNITGQTMRFLRKPLTYMKAHQYQIVAVDGILTETEYQRSKVIKSERIP